MISSEEYIAKMDAVDGWFSANDAKIFPVVDSVQKERGIDGNIVELGVWHGKSAILLFTLLREAETLHAVDLFDLRGSDHPYFNDPAIFDKHCQSFGGDERIKKVKIDSQKDGHELTKLFSDEKIRIFHVDGGHEYDIAKHDINLALACTSQKGAIVFDDFFNKRHPGVTQAVMEALFANRLWFPFLMTKKKLWICHIDMHGHYYNATKSFLGSEGKPTKFLGKSCIIFLK